MANSPYIYFMNRDELLALVANASWFSDYYVHSKLIGRDRYRVKTNYPWIQGGK